MGCATGSNGGGGCSGKGSRGRGASETMPRKGCMHNEGKDDDILCTSTEKMAIYIGTKFGNEAAQEWPSGKKIALTEPVYSHHIG